MDWEIQRASLAPDVERLGYIDIGIMTPDGTAKHIHGEEAQLVTESITKGVKGRI